MSTQRPAFSRENTDIALHELEPQRSSSSQPQAEFVVPKANDGKNTRESAKVEDVPSESPPPYEGERTRFGEAIVIEDAKDLVTTVIHVEDDESLNPWTFRMFFLGIGLSIFGSVLQEIFYFKPQTIYVSNVFLAVIAYVLGEFMSVAIPQKGVVGRFLNPGSFNLKEHAAVCIMASAAAQSALSTQAVISLLESLHRDKAETKQQLKLFYIIFIGIFLWEIIPEVYVP
ncbi:hypothetical protein SLS56_006342 [Neofusicoccum ribis]|uniref:Oligopeptide transporter n=1 Tax=Neofusicoccum ribis TaxID=45134 RepID=A0ABR3SQY2_9PEZI